MIICISSSKENKFDLNEQFLTAYNFCYERAKDITSPSADRKPKSTNPNAKNIENPSRTTAARPPKTMNKDASRKRKSLAAPHPHDRARDTLGPRPPTRSET